MSRTILIEGDDGVRLIIKDVKPERQIAVRSSRSPVHVVYGGADRFNAETSKKLGRIALDSIKAYAPNFVSFAKVFDLPGAEHLPAHPKAIKELDAALKADAAKVKRKDRSAWYAWMIFQRTIEKLRNEPIEDLRIDFEDGYGFRSDEEEDGHAVAAATELAIAFKKKRTTPFSGFRVKSFAAETHKRATRTLDLFLNTLVKECGEKLPSDFVVTLPKVTSIKEVKDICKRLAAFEKRYKMPINSVGLELMIETPGSLIDKKGRIAVGSLVNAAKGRCTSVHFGAYDYTASLGISASHQDIRHPACSFARQIMQAALAGTDVRLSDSVTTQIPVPIIKKDVLTEKEVAANTHAVHAAWRRHFENVTASMADGFYQSWDLHPNQLVARYAAIYHFFLSEKDAQGARLKGFLQKATQANLTGNTFDDAASAQGLLNFFRRGRDCGAFEEAEVKASTGLLFADLDKGFAELSTKKKR